MKFFCTINGTHHNVRNMNFRVDGEPAGLVGAWVNGVPYAPDKAQFRAALPYRWRKAFDRAGGFWFRDRPGQPDHDLGYVALTDRRGKYLATVYFLPDRIVGESEAA